MLFQSNRVDLTVGQFGLFFSIHRLNVHLPSDNFRECSRRREALTPSFGITLFPPTFNLFSMVGANFHPLKNTATITIKSKDFVEFMIENNKKIHIFSSTEEVISKIYE